ncbi:MAG: hypothetical protein ACLSA0_23500 [Eisenbergiella massiliensis]
MNHSRMGLVLGWGWGRAVPAGDGGFGGGGWPEGRGFCAFRRENGVLLTVPQV